MWTACNHSMAHPEAVDELNNLKKHRVTITILYSRTFLVYLFIRFAHISYRQFTAIRYKFKLSTYIQELLVIGEIVFRQRFKREKG
jgi:hypothetical protein